MSAKSNPQQDSYIFVDEGLEIILHRLVLELP